jgi:hypothetical protein
MKTIMFCFAKAVLAFRALNYFIYISYFNNALVYKQITKLKIRIATLIRFTYVQKSILLIITFLSSPGKTCYYMSHNVLFREKGTQPVREAYEKKSKIEKINVGWETVERN